MSAAGWEHAIVVGGSIAGLIAARALRDHFARVTVLERDQAPDGALARSGVPQGRHAHLLLRGGQTILERMLPGLERELVDAGSIALRVGDETRTIDGAGVWPQRDLGIINNVQTRPLLEHIVRSRVAAMPGITLRWGCRVDGLLADSTSRRAVGVKFNAEGKHHELRADLVVDAAGGKGCSLDWLREHGWTLPDETRIEVDIAYSTAMFVIPGSPRLSCKTLLINPGPPSKRGALLMEVEGGRWIVGLAGRLGDYPPADIEGYKDYAKSLHVRELYDAISDLDPIGPITRFRYPTSIRRRFERLADFPDGVLPLGDALCSFNPIYGQGMSSAAQQADALATLLGAAKDAGQSAAGVWRKYFPVAAAVVSTPWAQAGSADLAYPETRGVRPSGFEQSQQFARALTQLAMEDAEVHALLIRVVQLITPREAFRDPALVARVLEVAAREPAAR
jgi:2-polyprenyl-6-methoxyphenol hydroxylase-like FAD-dependent oxidoreductase